MDDVLAGLDPYAHDQRLRVVVESPRGACVKFEWLPAANLFRIQRPLPVGLAYPCDWGFIPGTRAPDGDPVDAVLLGEQVAYPGTLVEGSAIATLQVRERPAGATQARANPRIVVVPAWLDRGRGRGAVGDPARRPAGIPCQGGRGGGQECAGCTLGNGRRGERLRTCPPYGSRVAVNFAQRGRHGEAGWPVVATAERRGLR